ncbi:MAG: FAD-dependent oxidoreductase [Candidatus Aminicenantes bacterium]|nr:FAD-dependent oxidoreductase [Candidatus Aminicenantes bacterium]
MIPARPPAGQEIPRSRVAIERNAAAAEATTFDLIIVGGGIYSVMLALEAGRRGKRSLVLERDDFGGAASWNHLRTIHGGLRYLQSLDLPRFFESVAERRWFLANLPVLVRVLPCLMPLYGRGLKRASIMRAALQLNDLLGWRRNRGVGEEQRLPAGRIVDACYTRDAFPQVDRRGLQGSALWYDAFIPEHQRLLMETLRWACSLGAMALNYVEVESLLLHHNQVRGVLARDRPGGRTFEFRAPVVINAAGPWCRRLAQRFDQDHPRLFRRRLLLFNVLFKRRALSEYALALTPRCRPDHTYFVHNWKRRLLAGTGEVPVPVDEETPSPRPEDIAAFIADINDAVPELTLREQDIEHVYSGTLPARASGDLSGREVILAHGDRQGPVGLFSVSGVKFTTSRRVAEKTLRRIFPPSRARKIAPPAEALSGRWFFPYDWRLPADHNLGELKPLIEEEAVVHLDDLVFRRTGLGENRQRLAELLPRLRPLFAWNDLRWEQERVRVTSRSPGPF